MEDLEKKALLAEKIKCTSRHARHLASIALFFDACLEDVSSWRGTKSSPSEASACYSLDDIKSTVGSIEESFSDLRNFINESF